MVERIRLTAGTSVTIPTVSISQGLSLKAWYFAAENSASIHPAVVLLHGCSGVYSFYVRFGTATAG